MYRRDPIQDSSPMAPHNNYDVYNKNGRADFSDSDDGFITQPTLPLPANDIRSSYFPNPQTLSTNPGFVTQPTQLLTTPPRSKAARDTQVQVARSSPTVDRTSSPSQRHSLQQRFSSQNPRPLTNAFAPPGTYLRRPPPAQRPPVIDLAFSDPPVEADSDEEQEQIPTIGTGSPNANRVVETPHKPMFLANFMSAEFGYKPETGPQNANGKRPASNAVGSPQAKKARSMPQQGGPSRAAAPQVHIEKLEDIKDFGMRSKVQRLKALHPTRSFSYIATVLASVRGNYESAMDRLNFLAENEQKKQHIRVPSLPPSSDDELSITHTQPAKTAKVQLEGGRKSIHDKFSKIRDSQSYPSPAATQHEEPVRKRGRLQRGRRNPTPEPAEPIDLTSNTPEHPKSKPKKPVVVDDSDADEGIVAVSDDDSEAEMTDEGESDDAGLLKFFNICTVEGLIDLSNAKEDVAQAVIEKRPFDSLNDIEEIHVDNKPPPKNGKKARKPATTAGMRLLDFARSMWNGYKAIDQLVDEVKEKAEPVKITMSKWGVDIFGASTEGEVALTTLGDSDENSLRDSGIGTPLPGSDNEADAISKKPRANGGFLKKPSIMNKDVALKDYQEVGLNWLALLWKHGLSCILADDMGLGKTCQVIAFLSYLKEKKVQGPHVIVVPGSTLENWLREFKKFSDQLVVEPYYGLQADRAVQRDNIEQHKASIDVIVTTYDLATKEIDNKFLRKCRPHAVIFDEGHMLRNSKSDRYKSLMKISAEFRLLLTGTPLQNNLRELGAILAFIMPEVFQGLQEDLNFVFKHRATTNNKDTHNALLSTERVQRARDMIAPFMLRRKKAQVLKHMPTKTCRVEYCELTKSQKEIYNEFLAQQRQVFLDREAGLPTKSNTNIMMKLRQAAIHPLLHRHRFDDATIRKIAKACIKVPQWANSNPDLIYEDLGPYSDWEISQLALPHKALRKFTLEEGATVDSGKVQKLVELLRKNKANGDRTLVFSQFTSVMDILQSVLDNEEIQYFRLDGQTPIPDRQDMLDRFHDDESIPVFMLSTKSGGAGINLACANKVIIFDSSFNPQDDIQAENRAHRVGQTRDVEVIRLVTKDTVEEQIHALGVSKLALDKLVAGEEAEEAGAKAVEDALREQLLGKKEDVKEQFLDGLKKAGLNMNAA